MEVEENQEQNIIRLDTVNKVKENMLEEEINIVKLYIGYGIQ